MIPQTNYYPSFQLGFPYITKRLFFAYHSAEEWMVFSRWMRGQTVTVINDEVAIYAYDYERWVSLGKGTDQGSDWD